MSASSVEQPSLLSAPQAGSPEIVEVLAELQGMHREAVVIGVDAIRRVDYTGPASHKVRAGGALVVGVIGMKPEGPWRSELEINETHRPLSEPAIAVLGALANERARRGESLIRDIL